MSERTHPDLFSPDEAAAYLHLSNIAPLETAEKEGWLRRYKIGRDTVYYRPDLDDCALRIIGEAVPERVKRKAMKLTGT